MAGWKEETRRIAAEMTQIPQIHGEEIPDIDLYLDQVITYLEKRLEFFQRDSRTPLITGTMVNNYSKAGLTRPANRKRYDRAHVMALNIICQLKRMLSIQDMSKMSGAMEQPDRLRPVYQLFLDTQQQQFSDMPQLAEELIRRTEDVGVTDGEQEQALAAMVLQLSAQAQRDILLAERLIDRLGRQDPKGKRKEKGRNDGCA